MAGDAASELVTPCPVCACRAVWPTPPDPQRFTPGVLCRQCGIERADLKPFEDTERAPVPPCPACGDRDLRIELGRVVQLSLFGPPVARNVTQFLCVGCGQKRDDYDPDDWPDDDE